MRKTVVVRLRSSHERHAEFGVRGSAFRVQGSEFRVLVPVLGFSFRVLVRVQGSRSVQGYYSSEEEGDRKMRFCAVLAVAVVFVIACGGSTTGPSGPPPTATLTPVAQTAEWPSATP